MNWNSKNGGSYRWCKIAKRGTETSDKSGRGTPRHKPPPASSAFQNLTFASFLVTSAASRVDSMLINNFLKLNRSFLNFTHFDLS